MRALPGFLASKPNSKVIEAQTIMDGFSAAASAFGVVSLAVQLIQLTQNLRDFFNDVSGAPTEIRRLTMSLTQLASVLRDIQVITKMQQAQEGAPSAPLSLLASLKACEEKLLLLKTIVESSEQKLRASGRVSKHWESFKVVFKKKDIERLGEHLQESIQFLTAAITMNLMVLKYVYQSNHLYPCLRSQSC